FAGAVRNVLPAFAQFFLEDGLDKLVCGILIADLHQVVRHFIVDRQRLVEESGKTIAAAPGNGEKQHQDSQQLQTVFHGICPKGLFTNLGWCRSESSCWRNCLPPGTCCSIRFCCFSIPSSKALNSVP